MVIEATDNQSNYKETSDNPDKELVTYSDYSLRLMKESKLVANKEVFDKEIMRCPRCGETRLGIEHGHTESCSKCSLKMQVFGNALYIWQE
jgi:ribosomal protein S27AE